MSSLRTTALFPQSRPESKSRSSRLLALAALTLLALVLLLPQRAVAAEEVEEQAAALAAASPVQLSTPLVFTDSTPDAMGDGYAWTLATKTLALSGIDLHVTAYDPALSTGSAIVLPADSNVVFSGNNSISTSVNTSGSDWWAAIECSGATSFSGNDGAQLSASSTGDGSFGIASKGHLSLTKGIYQITGSSSSGSNAMGLYVEQGGLSISSATVTATGTQAGTVVEGGDSITLEGSTLNTKPLAAALDARCYALISKGDVESTNSSIVTEEGGSSIEGSLTLLDSTYNGSSDSTQPGQQSILRVAGACTLQSSTMIVTSPLFALDAFGSFSAKSSIVNLVSRGFMTSAFRVGGDVSLEDTRLTVDSQGEKSTGVTFIANGPATRSGTLSITRGYTELKGTAVAIKFYSELDDSQGQHLILGESTDVTRGGSLKYAQNGRGVEIESVWSFSELDAITWGSPVEGASPIVVIEETTAPKPEPKPEPEPTPPATPIKPTDSPSKASPLAATGDFTNAAATLGVVILAIGAFAACRRAAKKMS